ncbi:MAG: tetratricopeptide repeat protein [Spirochaetota bacterium]
MNKKTAVLIATLHFAFCHMLFAQASDSAPALYEKGKTAQDDDDFFTAIELYKTALKKNPVYIDPIFGLAESYFMLGEYEEALKWIQLAQKLNKTRFDFINLEGRIYIGLGDFQKSKEIFQKVLTQQPNSLEANFGLAELDVALGKPKVAANRYLEALRFSPDNRRALLSLVVLYDSFGDTQKAGELIRQALRYYADNPQVHYIAAKHFFAAKDLSQAELQVKTALSLKSDYLDAVLLLSDLYMVQGAYEKVIPLINTALATDRSNNLLWYNLGYAHERLKNSEEGIQAYTSAFTVKSDDEISRLALEYLIINNLDMDNPLRSRYAAYHFKKAADLEEKNYFNQALYEYRRGLKIDPYSKEGRASYARLFNKMGFPARYLAELKVLQDTGNTDRDILDEIEINTSLLEESVSNTWGINQFALSRPQHAFSIYYAADPQSFMEHYHGEEILAYYLKDLCLHYENITVKEEPQIIGAFAEAFRNSRQSGTDYFVILKLNERSRYFSASMEVYLSKTGALLDSFNVFRTGNDRISGALQKLAEDLNAKLTPRGSLLKRNFNVGLINLGLYDGIKKDDTLYILKSGALALKNDELGLTFTEDKILGELTITRVDELVSEGTIEKRLFFDMINEGDEVLVKKVKEEGPKKEAFIPLNLYRDILKIR